MRSWIKKILIGSLIVQSTLLVGCGTKQADKVAMGRYIEQERNISQINEENQTFITQKSDGKLQIFNIEQDGLKVYEEQQDTSFKEIEMPWIKAYNKIRAENGVFLNCVDLDADNQPYIIVWGYIEGVDEQGGNPEDMYTYIITTSENQESDLKIMQLQIEGEKSYILPTQLEVLPNGDCIVGGQRSGILQFNLESGNLVRTYSKDEPGKFMVKQDKLYVASTVNQAVDVYNMSSGQVEQSIPVQDIDENSYILQGEQGIYLMNHGGINHLADGGEVWEELMTSTGVSLGLPSYYVDSAFYREGEFIARLVNNERVNKLKAYVYSETTPSKPETELTAYILEDNQTVREALVNYELNHPEVRINVQQGVSEESGISKEDAIKALHTELLAGEGPDILLLDGLDLKSYTEKKLLADLEDVPGMDTVLPQIREAFKQEDGMYAVPLRFSVPCFIGTKDVLSGVDSIEELMAYQKAHSNTPIITHMTPLVLFNSMAPYDSAQWLTEDGKLDQESVQEFLEGIQTLTHVYDKNHVALEEDDDLVEAFSMISGETKMQLWDIKDIWYLLFASDMVKQRGEGEIKVIKQAGKTCFKPVAMVGVNQNSKDLALAKEIIGDMLAEDNQKVDVGEGFPTTQNAIKAWLEGKEINQNMGKAAGLPSENGESEYSIAANWENRGLLPKFEEELTQLAYPIMGNHTLETMVLQEATPYFKGEKSLEEVITALESKVALYNEG